MRVLANVFRTATLLGLFVSASVSGQFDPLEAAVARFDAAVARGVADDGGGCVSVAIFEGSEVLWAKGWGWADVERRIACTEETIGRTGSISKSFTAVLTMQLVERGVIRLDDPVLESFPEIAALADPPAEGSPITYRMLASHTAGLIREPRLEEAASGSIYLWERKILESIPHTTFRTPPGSEYSYSNIGFGILGLASSRAAGVPFIDLVESQIFRPLGMTSSTFLVDSPDLAARLSVGYRRLREDGTLSAEPATREHFGRGYKVPNGGIYSTVRDLARFAAALMGESPVQILSAESREAMLRPQAPAERYGLGFSVSGLGGSRVVGHGGSVAGYNANLLFAPDSGIGVAMLRTTTFNPPTAGLLRDLLDASKRRPTFEERAAQATANGREWLAASVRRRQILQLNRDLEEAFRAGDMKGVAAFYTDDALRIGPDARASGREALLEYWQGISQPVDLRLHSFDITGDDDTVHQSGRSHLTHISDGEEKTLLVDFMLVWRRQEDGEYRIAVDSSHHPQPTR